MVFFNPNFKLVSALKNHRKLLYQQPWGSAKVAILQRYRFEIIQHKPQFKKLANSC